MKTVAYLVTSSSTAAFLGIDAEVPSRVTEMTAAAHANRVAATTSIPSASNARFDLSFLRAELERACDVVFRPQQLCTVRLSRVLVPELRRRNLDSVIDWFGITTDQRHRAAGDAIATAEVLGRLLGRATERGVGTWRELSAL